MKNILAILSKIKLNIRLNYRNRKNSYCKKVNQALINNANITNQCSPQIQYLLSAIKYTVLNFDLLFYHVSVKIGYDVHKQEGLLMDSWRSMEEASLAVNVL